MYKERQIDSWTGRLMDDGNRYFYIVYIFLSTQIDFIGRWTKIDPFFEINCAFLKYGATFQLSFFVGYIFKYERGLKLKRSGQQVEKVIGTANSRKFL